MKSALIFLLFVALATAYPAADSSEDSLPFEGIQTRILGGKPAQPNQFPYQVRLWLTKPHQGKLVDSLCGGSLILEKVILTAAHCLHTVLYGTVLLGATDLKKNEPTRVTVKVDKKDFILHENWDPKDWKYDIALIMLPVSVRFNDAVNVVRLASADQVDLVNRMGTISGFGLVGNAAEPPKQLLYVERRILEHRYCESSFGKRYMPYHLCVDGSFVKSACAGDSGGPLVITEKDDSKTLVGVTSFGSGNCEMGYPTVYVRVTSFLDWIHKHTGIPVKK